jgi:hypothetical protein
VATTTFNGGQIIPEDTLQFLLPGAHNILQLAKQNGTAIMFLNPSLQGKIKLIYFSIISNNTSSFPSYPTSRT